MDESKMQNSISAQGNVSQKKVILAGTVGNAIEWFDWTIYATFAVFFAKQFFPSDDPTASLLATFAIFAVGFFMRPLGGIVLGIFSDRYGRKAALAATIIMMAGGSLMIGLSPTYESIGIFAPIILVLARLLQGLSLGGEFASAATYLSEMAPKHKRGFYSSFMFFSSAIGILMASGLAWALTSALTETQMSEYGWRIPFILGAIGGLVGMWIRKSVPDSEMTHKKESVKNPLAVLIKRHPKETLRIVGISILTTFAFYIFVVYVPTYAIKVLGAEPQTAFAANTVGLIIFMLCQPVFGWLSDKIGRKPQLIVFAAGYLVFFYPIIKWMDGTFASILLVELFGLVLYALYTAIGPAVMSEQFPTEVRAVGIGAPYNLMVALLGGTTPYVLTWLQSIGKQDYFYFMVLVGALLTLITFIKMPETAGKGLEDIK
ncbi:MFS transporter [Acinetobacter sp. RF15A]|uniref:MFS transporter n=1 Tax=unclassified Acinetobacter TaxID=196816 RepID=UPI00116C250A|nr:MULTISPECIES: MFS transporter [unclassified Acinetobacter]TQR66370.1 MFS transporter [Acinetobacter sp. RF14B]TSH78542.1 MFS transporter [Acinetobacter sp. RF15A]TSI20869.1 MFS transporter [Acinetobacter sp. RF15B]